MKTPRFPLESEAMTDLRAVKEAANLGVAAIEDHEAALDAMIAAARADAEWVEREVERYRRPTTGR